MKSQWLPDLVVASLAAAGAAVIAALVLVAFGVTGAWVAAPAAVCGAWASLFAMHQLGRGRSQTAEQVTDRATVE